MVLKGMTLGRTRPSILCFVDYYLPGFRSGGPVRTLANFVDHLGDEFDIYVVTRDHDSLDPRPYEAVVIDSWNCVGRANVFYASSKTLTLFGIASLLRNTPHDVLYLNSFFSFKFTALPLLARRLGLVVAQPCVIAPRGEFSTAALALKRLKKLCYKKFSTIISLYSDLVWQASSEFERADIKREIGAVADFIQVACDLPPAGPLRRHAATAQHPHTSELPLRIIFLSRITQMKNLDFLLQALSCSKSIIHLSIYGPLEDPEYWACCQSLIASLPASIKVDYRGEVEPSKVLDVFSCFDLFVLPTLGENYGHVVLESLASGTPVLISDQTPWVPSSGGALEVLPLGDPALWSASIDRWALYDQDKRTRLREDAFSYAAHYIDEPRTVDTYKELFLKILSGSSF